MFPSAKIYGYRVDALHSETQKLNGSIENEEEDEWSISHPDQTAETIKKLTQRSKPKASSYLVTDLSTISLPYEFDFHACQPSSMCQWPGGVGFDSVYADMVSYTMYSSSDFPLVHGFIDLNSRVNKEYDDNERVLGLAMRTIYDLVPLREVIRDEQEQDHILGNVDAVHCSSVTVALGFIQDVNRCDSSRSTRIRPNPTSKLSTNALSSTDRWPVLTTTTTTSKIMATIFSATVSANYAMIRLYSTSTTDNLHM